MEHPLRTPGAVNKEQAVDPARRPLAKVPMPEPLLDAPVPDEGGETDRELMDLAKKGDMPAYARLFQRYADRIGRMAYLILHSPVAAEDVVQETFTRGLAHLKTYRGESDPRAWFFSIALNHCRHYLRDRNREAELVDSDKLELGRRVKRPRTRGVLTSLIRRENSRSLMVALGYLTQAQREVFVLHHIDDLPYEDIGRLLDITPGAARALAFRAKAVLQKQLGFDPDQFKRG